MIADETLGEKRPTILLHPETKDEKSAEPVESEHDYHTSLINAVAAVEYVNTQSTGMEQETEQTDPVGVDITSGPAYNDEVRNLNNTVREIIGAITQIKSAETYVGKYAVVRGGDPDGTEHQNLRHNKALNEANYKIIDQYERKKEKPYIYRVDVKQNDGSIRTYYMGPEALVLDGKTVVYSFFGGIGEQLVHADADDASMKHMQLRRKLFIKASHLDRFRNLTVRREEGLPPDKVSDPFLIHILESRRQDHDLTDIVVSIQQEQDQIVKASYNQNFIVQGCAGSGKTMVMLQRLSRLQNYEKAFDPKEVLILTPSTQYTAYIDTVTQELAIQKIKQLTIENYYISLLSEFGSDFRVRDKDKVIPDWAVDGRLVEYIYSDLYIERFEDAFDEVIDRRRALYSEFAALYLQLGLKDLPAEPENEADVQVNYRSMINSLNNLDEERKNAYQSARESEELLVKDSKNLKKELDALELKTEENYKKLWKDTREKLGDRIDALKENTDAASQLLAQIISEFVENNKAPNTVEIPKLILTAVGWAPEVREYFNKSQKISRDLKDFKEMMDARPAILLQAKKKTEAAKSLLFSKEVEGKIADLSKEITNYSAVRTYHQIADLALAPKLKELNMKKPTKLHRFDLYSRLHFCRMFYDQSLPSYNFVCIDEGQDAALNEYRLIRDINGSRAKYNIYGDSRQVIHPERGVNDWNDLMRLFNADIYFLNENYRNTEPINHYCNDYFHMDVKTVGLPGEKVEEISIVDVFSKIENTSSLQGERWAIIIPDDLNKEEVVQKLRHSKVTVSADKIGPDIISVVYVEEVKGFEFEVVFSIADHMSSNQQYIAMTRGLEKLYVVQSDREHK